MSAAAGRRRRAAVLAAAIAATLATTGCGDSDEPTAQADPFRAIPEDTVVAPADKAAPRWEPAARFSGSGAATKTVNIAEGAIQWRARWRCENSGRFAITIAPAPRSGSARAGGECPGRGEHAWVTSGRRELRVAASGPWRIEVEQEVDTALHEPPLDAMKAPDAKVLARGDFYEIDRRGSGSASLYRLPGGRLALRMEDFTTEANTDLFVWLSEARRPRNTRAVFRAPHIEVGGLKSTLGDQNYMLPRDLDTSKIRSIVIWCEPVQNAYTAAPLAR